MSARAPIGVAIIARNEAANLRRCLPSVAPWVSGIVVVVNACTDDTVEVARGFGAEVVERPWTNYREQKNAALERVTQPWVLALDADEEVTPALAEEIRAFVAGAGDDVAGADMPRCSWFLGRWIRHGDWYPDRCLRVFRTGRGRWAGAADHTRVEVDGRVARLRADLLHHPYPTLRSQLLKIGAQGEDFVARQAEEGRAWSLRDAVFRPVWRFVRGYVLRGGFLDGVPGFYIACAVAFGTLHKYARLYEREVAARSSRSRNSAS